MTTSICVSLRGITSNRPSNWGPFYRLRAIANRSMSAALFHFRNWLKMRDAFQRQNSIKPQPELPSEGRKGLSPPSWSGVMICYFRIFEFSWCAKRGRPFDGRRLANAFSGVRIFSPYRYVLAHLDYTMYLFDLTIAWVLSDNALLALKRDDSTWLKSRPRRPYRSLFWAITRRMAAGPPLSFRENRKNADGR